LQLGQGGRAGFGEGRKGFGEGRIVQRLKLGGEGLAGFDST
jgi:hypothetical protein